MDRRLAAVMIADVVGYSRLSQLDEEGTRARFQASIDEVFRPRIAEYKGRLVKTMGDGVLVEFQSVINALRCAVEIQKRHAERIAAEPPQRRLEFRIGINLGDVLVEGDDIHGTGVNIAERLQALARPGGVVISGTAYDQITNRLDVGYEFLGEQRVKNIAEPVRVYGVTGITAPVATMVVTTAGRRAWVRPMIAAAAVLAIAAATAIWWRPWASLPAAPVASAASPAVAPSDMPSLVVLPFDNLSDDKEQGYLAGGITEDLTTELARIAGLFVISRNAAFAYKDKPAQPSAIASDLGVRYLLEGSIRRAGDDIRINAQLIDGESSGHLWAERFDGAWSDVFELQDEVIEEVAGALKLRLVSGPRMATTPGGTNVPAAYELYLQAYGISYGRFPAEAAALYRQALALDPNFGQA
jgi:TolB-like protein/class 3 adenylate cyclase